jgi:tRNA threonylcarbamoyl adenosine modification protein (Sua5/YciO/YrdC/YwlC family)
VHAPSIRATRRHRDEEVAEGSLPTVTVAQAVALNAGGEPVAFPTETVYGLGADARSPLAIRKVFALKGRPTDHPLILHLGPGMPLEDWALPNDAARALGTAFWPGPLSLVLPRTSAVLDEVTGGSTPSASGDRRIPSRSSSCRRSATRSPRPRRIVSGA